MARVFIGMLAQEPTGLRCLECRQQITVSPLDGLWPSEGSIKLCLACAAEVYDGQGVATGGVVVVDPQIMAVQERDFGVRFVEIGTEGRGQSSPRWVSCPKCGAYRGDQCRGDDYCAARVEANRERLTELETWGVRRESPCHKTPVWLCWRTAENELMWSGVPCFAEGCGQTFQFCAHADELVPERVPVERLHPDHVQMTCWATEDDNPWKR